VAGHAEYITVPVRADSDSQLMMDVLIAKDPAWSRKVMNRLKAWYGRATHAKHYLPRIDDILGRKHQRLVDLNYDDAWSGREIPTGVRTRSQSCRQPT
jgi:WbqC-like protein family